MGAGTFKLYGIGQRGVDIVTKPQDIDEAELQLGQNAEIVPSIGGEGGLDQRAGMTKLTGSPLAGGGIVLCSDIPVSLIEDFTAYLYAGQYTGAGHNWRKSSDGTTWTNDDTPVKGFSNQASIAYFKNIGKVVTVRNKMYYCDGSSPIRLYSYDGTTNVLESTIPNAPALIALSAPTLTSATFQGKISNATYTYKVVARAGDSHSAVSGGQNATNAAQTLDKDNINVLVIAGPVANAKSYDVYRTTAPAPMTTGKIGSVGIAGAAFVTGSGSPVAGKALVRTAGLAVNPTGTTGSTFYTYMVVARYGETIWAPALVPVRTTTGNATLDGTNYNAVQWTGDATASHYDVYRISNGSGSNMSTVGKIGTVVTNGSTGTKTYNDQGLGGDNTQPPSTTSGGLVPDSAAHFVDAGLVGDGTTPPSNATIASTGAAAAVLDMVSDGENIFVLTSDALSDPNNAGRILKFNPVQKVWSQIGPTFSTQDGSGSPATAAMVNGAVTYGTYIGTTAGNTAYVSSHNTQTPLPGGGVPEIHTFAANVVPLCLCMFLGELYVGCGALNAAAAQIFKRTADGQWSSVKSAPGTTATNAWTSMIVHNGKIIAGWANGNDAGVNTQVFSSSDGGTWTSELSLDKTSVPGQMVLFPPDAASPDLYLVFGKTGAAWNTTSKTYKRTAAASWSAVDDSPSGGLNGSLGVVYY